MRIVEVDESTDAMINEVARRMGKTKNEVVKMMMKGQLTKEGDDGMKEEYAKLLAKKGDVFGGGDPIEKLINYKMMTQLTKDEPRADTEDIGMAKLMNMMIISKMFPQDKQGMDPMMMMILMDKMGGDKGKGGSDIMAQMIQMQEASAQRQQAFMQTLMQQMFGDQESKELMGKMNQLQEEVAYNRQLVLEGGQRRGGNDRDRDDHMDLDKAVEMKKKMEEVGMIKPGSDDERVHQRVLAHQEGNTKKEMKELDIVDHRLNNFEVSIDKKMDMFLNLLLEEQRVRMRQQGIEPTVQSQPRTPEEKMATYQEIKKKLDEAEARETQGDPGN